MNEPVWISLRDALAIHEKLLALFGGPEGIRDRGLLESALARPRQILAYQESADFIELAAALTAGVVRNHPFVDGNKRTGFLLGVLFLEINNFRFTASEADATLAVRSLAAGTLDEASFTNWLRASVVHSKLAAQK